jgi:hypothetical protein
MLSVIELASSRHIQANAKLDQPDMDSNELPMMGVGMSENVLNQVISVLITRN